SRIVVDSDGDRSLERIEHMDRSVPALVLVDPGHTGADEHQDEGGIGKETLARGELRVADVKGAKPAACLLSKNALTAGRQLLFRLGNERAECVNLACFGELLKDVLGQLHDFLVPSFR